MTKSTDTNQASELYELCREVYKRTGWRQEPDISFLYKYWDDYDELCVISIEEADDTLVPAYASDYLLEKLPRHIEYKKSVYHLTVMNGNRGDDNWIADYYTFAHTSRRGWYMANKVEPKMTEAGTPLKALLKLIIALSEAGELDNDQSS